MGTHSFPEFRNLTVFLSESSKSLKDYKMFLEKRKEMENSEHVEEYNFGCTVPKDLEIIYLPETEKTPQEQIIFIRDLVVNLNLNNKRNIALLTHSDYIIRELTACLILSNFNDLSKFKNIPYFTYTKEHKLTDVDISVYKVANIELCPNPLIQEEVSIEKGVNTEIFNSTINLQTLIGEILCFALIDQNVEE